jgi:hypothetical protein
VETVGPGDTVGSAELRSQTSAGMVLDWVLCGVGLAGGIAGGLLFPERRAEIVASSLLVPIGMVLFDGLTGRASAHPSRDVVLHLEPKRYPVSYGLTMVAGLRAAGGKGSFVAYATERRPLSAEQPVVLGDGDLRSRWQWDGRHLTLVLAAAPADHNLTIRWSQATIRHASGSICPLVPVADVDPASMEPQPVSTDGTYRQEDWPPSEAMLPPDFQAYDLPLPALPPAASAEGAAEAHRGQTLSITLPAFVDGEPRTYRFDLAITDVVLSQPAAAAR